MGNGPWGPSKKDNKNNKTTAVPSMSIYLSCPGACPVLATCFVCFFLFLSDLLDMQKADKEVGL